MKKYKGFMMIDCLLSFSVVSIITLMLLPMYITMSNTYEQKKLQLEQYRIAYVEIVINKRGGYISNDAICYTTDKRYCIQK